MKRELGSRMLFVAPRRILASCTELMQAIKVLVLSSKDLQRDIVESGRVSTHTRARTHTHTLW